MNAWAKAVSGLAMAAATGCTVYAGGDLETQVPNPADVVIRNARLHGSGAPRGATAIAVKDGWIAAVGSDAEIGKYVGLKTRVMNADGGAVTPGLQDAHGHLRGLGEELDQADLRGARSVDELVARVTAFGKEHPGGWLLGRGWDQNLWPGGAFPTHEALRAIFPERPIFLTRVDGHAAFANLAAIRLADVNVDTVDPSGGRIVRDDRGQPTGVFIDAAMGLVRRRIPRPNDAALERFYLAAQSAALSVGLTCVHDAGIDADGQSALRRLDGDGRLRLRVYGMATPDAMPAKPERGNRFELRAVKGYADGALGSRGAALLEDYSDEPGNRGLVLNDMKSQQALAAVCMRRGLQFCVHAIGDRGNRETLDAFDVPISTRFDFHPPLDNPRWRIEHCQVVADSDFARFKDLGLIASMQPTHATSDGPWAPARVGAKRMEGAYAWRRFLDLGVPLAFGSDFPVESPDPRLGLFAAVTRRAPDNPDGPAFGPSPPLSPDDALAAFTSGAAYASFHEKELGSLAPGYIADLTVFDRDPFSAADPRAFLDARVVWTVIEGDVVFELAAGASRPAALAPAK